MAKLLYVVIALVVLLGLATIATPFMAQYEVKRAARVTCSDFFRAHRDIQGPEWRDDFVRKARIAGVNLKSDQQYLFQLEKRTSLNMWHCRFKVAWNSETPVIGIGELVTELPKIKITHRIDETYEVPIKY